MIYARPLPESEEYGEEVEVWETIDYVDWQDFLERNYSEIYGVVLSETTERTLSLDYVINGTGTFAKCGYRSSASP